MLRGKITRPPHIREEHLIFLDELYGKGDIPETMKMVDKLSDRFPRLTPALSKQFVVYWIGTMWTKPKSVEGSDEEHN